MSWSATIYNGYCVSSRKFAPSDVFPALTVNNDVFQVCGRDTRRQYAATPESFGTAASHSRWWLRIKKYPVRGLFQQCPVVVVLGMQSAWGQARNSRNTWIFCSNLHARSRTDCQSKLHAESVGISARSRCKLLSWSSCRHVCCFARCR